MDNFMDKLAQKLNAQEIIKANSTAEAMEMKRLQAQVDEYERIMQDMRKVNLKNVELLGTVQQLADESILKINECQKQEADFDKLQESMEKTLAEWKQSVEAALQKSDEYVHTESVKVYRNVQAVAAEGFKEQLEKTAESEQKLSKKMGGVKPLIIITLILVSCNFIFNILSILGLIF